MAIEMVSHPWAAEGIRGTDGFPFAWKTRMARSPADPFGSGPTDRPTLPESVSIGVHPWFIRLFGIGF